MANDIKCPNCGTIIDVENVLAADIEQKLQQQYQDKLKHSLVKVEEDKRKLEADQLQFEEKKKNENEIFTQKLHQEKQKLETEILKAYNALWDANLSGDMKTFGSFLDSHITLFGSAEGEIFRTRKEALKYFSATADQVTGKVELRNIPQKNTNVPVCFCKKWY